LAKIDDAANFCFEDLFGPLNHWMLKGCLLDAAGEGRGCGGYRARGSGAGDY